ncbi:hypothetical protein [Pelagibius sp. Alg239-R121]|uniref:hypothetical protein n=1 Tax=Pelagibius sp. Alg239-R121 TaxID=2993448 RepID=UPI0024A75909|nr:hypothetical protein [Pelagibius sp. Alg239-R121]
MIELTSGRWQELSHAYGPASDIPDLLASLASCPKYTDWRSEPYFSLWSALCHQGEVYTASYAAVPHVIQIALHNPGNAHWDFILLPTSIELARTDERGPEVPADLSDSYFAASKQLPEVIAGMQKFQSSNDFAISAAAGIAVAGGHASLAKAILELSPDVIPDFLEWVSNR